MPLSNLALRPTAHLPFPAGSFPAGRTRASAPIIPITQRRAAARLASRDRLVESHMHLVPPIARTIQRSLPPSFELDDLIAAGYIGLIRAAERYSPDDFGGAPFECFARGHVRGAILDTTRRRAFRDATLDELESDDSLHSLSVREIEETFHHERQRARLAAAVAELPGRMRQVMELYYYADCTQIEISRRLGVSMSTVTKLKSRALALVHEQLAGA